MILFKSFNSLISKLALLVMKVTFLNIETSSTSYSIARLKKENSIVVRGSDISHYGEIKNMNSYPRVEQVEWKYMKD
jgi:hypothetical protein